MKYYVSRILNENHVRSMLWLKGEAAFVSFNDKAATGMQQRFMKVFVEWLPKGKTLLNIKPNASKGTANERLRTIAKQLETITPATGAVIIDHYNALLQDKNNAQEILLLRTILDEMAQKTKVPLIVLHRYSL